MDLFDLFCIISIKDEYSDGINSASTSVSNFSDKLKSGLATAAKVGAAAVTAASAAVTALTKNSIEQYGEYEQLAGGVETLFKASADIVQEYAANAYKTAGLSANEYMETVTSFSASLLQSLENDTEAAAEKADLAITDMADNANKMGTSMESIQNAYQGFAKQNYTMLDNLKLGYGGTKEEMERLLEDATALSGVEYDISSYADIVDAIHVIQTEMGITGTTAKEAATTIQGSVNAAKSAWKNLVTGIADENADLDTLIGNFVGSVETAAGNVIPRITQILSGMGTAIQQIAPIIATEVPALVSSVLPQIISAGAQLVVGLATGLIGALPELVAAVPEIVTSIVDAVSESLPEILDAGSTLLSMLADGIIIGIPYMLSLLPEVFTYLYNFLAETLPDVTEKGFDLLIALVDGIIEAIPDMVEKLPEVIKAMTSYFVKEFPTIAKKGGELLGHLIMGILGAIPEIAIQIPAVITAIADALEDGWEAIKQAGIYLLEGLWAGISEKVEWLKEKVGGVVDTVIERFTGKEGFDEHSPSKVFKTIGQYMMEGLALGMENGKGEVMETIEDIVGEVKSRFTALTDVLTARQDVGDLEFQLWERTIGANATDAEKYEKQLEILSAQQKDQESVVEAAAAAYEAIITQYGDSSAESYEYQKVLMQEMLSYQDLIDQINEVIAAKEALASMDGVSTVSFEDSAVGRTSAATINAISDAGGAYTQDVTLNATLVAPDGTKFANYYLPSFIKAGVANGTPIASGQYA